MKNKAFTLIEVLAVLVIISLLFAILYPSIKKVMKYSKNTTYDTQINTILKASYDYTLKHVDQLPDPDNNTDNLLLTLADLKLEGLIDINIVDPKTNKPFPDDLIINIKKSDCSSNTTCYKNGEYSYTINLNNTDNKPVITLLPNIENDTVSYGPGTYLEPTVSSVKVGGTDVTHNFELVKVITCDNKVVSSVNTQSYGIYYISYTVRNSTSATNRIVKVTVVDDKDPTISNTIATDIININQVDSYNILNGVTCSDNDKCEIIVEGSIKKKAGTYTIKYTAHDPSGNVSGPVYRLIRVE